MTDKEKQTMFKLLSAGSLVALLLPVAVPSSAAEVWRLRFAPKGAKVSISDFKFASSTQGVAVGRLLERRGSRPISLITTDGGRTWQITPTPAAGLSLFFLSEAAGWMVADNGLWTTADGGRTWVKLPADGAVGVTQVFFLDQNRGWGIGRRKALLRTMDGGESWTPVKAAAESAGSVENTSFDCITFVNDRFGMIAGASFPPPPKGKDKQRELPHLTIFLDTRDAGETWKTSTTSMFGRVTRIQFAPDGRGLGLIQFRSDFDYPSEVFSIEWKTGKSTRVFRRADCSVTDLALAPGGKAWLTGVDTGGRGPSEGARGRMKFFCSKDLIEWSEVKTDGRQLGRRSLIAVTPDGQLWAASDEGRLLQLVDDSKHE